MRRGLVRGNFRVRKRIIHRKFAFHGMVIVLGLAIRKTRGGGNENRQAKCEWSLSAEHEGTNKKGPYMASRSPLCGGCSCRRCRL